jgi:ABC-type sugar transport system ATPase subunit
MDGRHLILDEPTATLPAKEKQSLWTLIRQLSDAGMAVVLISHFLQEVIDLCDEITVLQDGRKVSHLSNAGHEVTERQLIDLMPSGSCWTVTIRRKSPTARTSFTTVPRSSPRTTASEPVGRAVHHAQSRSGRQSAPSARWRIDGAHTCR